MTYLREPDPAGRFPAPLCRADPHPHSPGIRLIGELDLATREVLTFALAALDDQPGDVRIDVSGLDFIDAASVAELVRFTRRRQPYRVIIESPSRLMLRIVDVLFAVGDLELG